VNTTVKIASCLLGLIVFVGVWWLFTLTKLPPVKETKQDQSMFQAASGALQSAREDLVRAEEDSQIAAKALAQLIDSIAHTSEDSLKESEHQAAATKDGVVQKANELLEAAKIAAAEAAKESKKCPLDKAESEFRKADEAKVQSSAEYQKAEESKKIATSAVAKATKSNRKALQSSADQAADQAKRAYEQMGKCDKEFLTAKGVLEQAKQLQVVLLNADNSLRTLKKEQSQMIQIASQNETKTNSAASQQSAASLESGRSSAAFIRAQENVQKTQQAIEIASQRVKTTEIAHNNAQTALEASNEVAARPETDLPSTSTWGFFAGVLAITIVIQPIFTWKYLRS